MRKKDGLIRMGIVLLAMVLLVGLCTSFMRVGRSEPDNPISSEAEYLDPESLKGSGELTGDKDAEGEGDTTETESETEPPTEEETESPTESTEEETEPPTEPDEGQESTESSDDTESSQDLTVIPEVSNDDEGNNTGGTTTDGEQGGLDDSGQNGNGDAGENGGGGGEGETGSGDEEENRPRIYTDLETGTITRSELPDGILSFVAYPLGEGENLSVRVRLKNNTYSGNGKVLTSEDGKNYHALLDFNAENTFILTLWSNSTLLGTVQYRISYYADKASEDTPEVGDYPPSIITNLDGESMDMTSRSFPLTVIARTHSHLGASPIYSNHITVTMDGRTVEKSYGDSQPTYQLYFDAPQIGDEEDHIIKILAWDGQGNSTMKIYTVTYHQISEGDPAGNVNIVLDATTVGLGILDSGEMSIVEGETAASVVLRFLEEYGYEADYQGNATTNFYLRRIYRGDIAYRASAQHWETLWTLIQRDGITTNSNYDRDSLGEFDFTQGSGWMYSINGTLYEGTGMSGYKVRNGITIYIRFTLAYGKDIGGYDATGGGYGKLSSYCGIWVNGSYQALSHDFKETGRQEPTGTKDGYIEYTCTKCQETRRDILPATGGGTEPTNPEPTNPEPTNPEPTNPEPTNPEPTNPEPTNPEPTNPEPTNPEPTNPEPTDPESSQLMSMQSVEADADP